MFNRSLFVATLASATFAALGSMPVAIAVEGAPRAEPPLIARSIIFGNPDKTQLRISPDGKQIAFLAPLDGVLNVYVAPTSAPDKAKAVTSDKSRGIRQYFWAYDNSHILYVQDQGGDENWKVYSVDLKTNQAKDLTPFDNIKGPDGQPIKLPSGKLLRPAAQIEAVSDKFPDTILVGLNNRNPQYHDVYRANITTGELKLVLQNDEYAGFETDNDFNVRFAMKQTAAGGNDVFKLTTPAGADGTGAKFESFTTIPFEDSLTTGALGLDKTGQTFYMTDSRGRDTGALTATDLKTGKTTVLAENPKADAGGVLSHPGTHVVQAVLFNYLKPEWTILDPTIKGDLDYLKTVTEGQVNVTSRSLDDNTWAVTYTQDNGPARSYIYDRKAHKASFVFTNLKALEGQPQTHMHPQVVKSRDGLDLVCYLSLPPESDSDNDARPDKPLPMVLYVHGGPWARDEWGLNGIHQWLANRGYAVLSVNYRGSTGFGKSFVNAGNKEWAAKMHDDLIDSINWAVKEKIALPKKIAIMGGSYGGYATLVGVTFTPDQFCCGVDIVGPSNIVTLLNTIPPYWAPMVNTFTTRVGDHRTEDGRKFLESRSPLTYVDKIKVPLLIGQGANDPRVKQAESDQIVKAMQSKNIPVTYVVYPDEGHGFQRPENKLSFFAVTEAFLASNLNGRMEPLTGADFKGSTITVPTGADQIKGLKEAMAK